jgi:O-antigen/teichoic acid export membrane protein
MVVAEFGLKNYLIQATELSSMVQRAAFGFALVTGLSLTGLTFATSQVLMEKNLIDPVLAKLLSILAFALMLQALQRPFFAILQRQMMFGALFVIGLVKATILAVTVIFFAWTGLGASSLAWGSIAEAVTGVLAALVSRGAAPWSWSWPSLRGWGPIVAFGGVSTAITGLMQLGKAAPSLAIGNILGFTAAGLFNRGQAVAGLFDTGIMQAILPIALPMIASHRRDGRDLKPMYEKKIAYLSGIAWPFFAFLALMAEPIIGILLGDAAVQPNEPAVLHRARHAAPVFASSGDDADCKDHPRPRDVLHGIARNGRLRHPGRAIAYVRADLPPIEAAIGL